MHISDDSSPSPPQEQQSFWRLPFTRWAWRWSDILLLLILLLPFAFGVFVVVATDGAGNVDTLLPDIVP